MKLTPLLLFPLLSGAICAASASCRPDASNTTLSVTSQKFYCSEGFDSEGCNIGRVRLKVAVDSTCAYSGPLPLECRAELDIAVRGVDHLPRELSQRFEIDLEAGKAEESLYLDWREFGDPALNVAVTDAACRIADASRQETAAEEPEAAAPEPVQPLPEPKAPPAKTQPAAPTASAPTAQPGELELLREQNRAKELEIKMLELKIKLKEMEASE